jgi:hypothetical protein
MLHPPPSSSEEMPLFSTLLPKLIIQRPVCDTMSFDWSDFAIVQQYESMLYPPPSSSEDTPLFSTTLPKLIIQRPACESMSFAWSDFPVVRQLLCLLPKDSDISLVSKSSTASYSSSKRVASDFESVQQQLGLLPKDSRSFLVSKSSTTSYSSSKRVAFLTASRFERIPARRIQRYKKERLFSVFL